MITEKQEVSKEKILDSSIKDIVRKRLGKVIKDSGKSIKELSQEISPLMKLSLGRVETFFTQSYFMIPDWDCKPNSDFIGKKGAYQRIERMMTFLNSTQILDPELQGLLKQRYPNYFQVKEQRRGNESLEQKVDSYDEDGYLTDPLFMIQSLARQYGVDLQSGKEWKQYYSGTRGELNNPNLIHLYLRSRTGSGLNIAIEVYDNDSECELLDFPKGLEEFVRDKKPLRGKYFRDFHVNNGNITDFQRYQKYLSFSIEYYEPEKSNPDALIILSRTSKDDEFKLKHIDFDENSTVKPFFEDITRATDTDFRPYLHRMFELFKGLEKPNWHHPRLYVDESKPKIKRNANLFSENDPLVFTREIAAQLGIRFPNKQKFYGFAENVLAVETQRELDDKVLNLNLGLWLYNGDHDKDDLPKSLVRFIKGKERNGGGLGSFNLLWDSLSDLGKFKMDFYYDVFLLEQKKPVNISTSTDRGVFLFSYPSDSGSYWSNPLKEADEKFYEEFRDISETGTEDFHPYIHRALEIFAGVPQKDWHNPAIYGGLDKRIEQVSDLTLSLLFTGEERVQMEARLADARLKMRNGYASVPKLCLGNIVMPTPGMKAIERDQFVLNASPLLVEYLHKLGVMTPEQAEEVVSRKLENYFVHRAGFQLSRDRAIQVVSQLKPSQINFQQEVA